jgi:hypothetical protein
MRHVNLLWVAAFVVGTWCATARSVSAQSALAGTVTDTTGAVLPGVTVEARSPALIEKSRTTVTDSQGQYRIVALQPGTYTVIFTLPGFATVTREGFTLEANFTATINAQMKVGGLEETVTVSGASPVVDVQSTLRREVLSRDLIDTLPTARSYSLIGTTLPAVNLAGGAGVGSSFDVGGNTSMWQGTLTAYGGTGVQSVLMDGMRLDSPVQSGVTHLYMNDGATEQYVYQVNGGSAESQLGVVVVNMIPRSGGNKFSGREVALVSSPGLQADNNTPQYQALGFKVAPRIDRDYDYNFGIGGPIKKDRVWFYSSFRDWTVDTRTNEFNDNLAVLGPPGSLIIDRNEHYAITNRVTWELGTKNRFGAMYEKEHFKRLAQGVATNVVRPEAANVYDHKGWPGNYYAVAKWTSTLSNRLLLEAGFAPNFKSWLNLVQPNYALAATAPAKLDVITGISYGNVVRTFYHPLYREFTNGSVSYITGAHALKIGIQAGHGTDTTYNQTPNGADLQQMYRSGVPFGVSVYDFPSISAAKISEVGFFAQDTWTIKRLTFNPGIRWDRFVGSVPAQTEAASRFFPAHELAPIDNVPNWKDISPRFGASFDLGGGKTVVKGSVGKYLQTFAAGFPLQYNPSQNSTGLVGDSRNWTDVNRDDIAQDNEIGPTRNPSYGLRVTRLPDPNLKRPYDLLYNLTFERQITEGIGAGVAYNRRDSKNLIYSQNLANPLNTDWQLLTVPDPQGTGQLLPVYQVLPAKVTGANLLDVNSTTNYQVYNGVDVTMHARVKTGMILNAGTSTGRIISNMCQTGNPNGAVAGGIVTNSLRFCDQSQYSIPFLTIFKTSVTYPLPWQGLRISAVFQSVPGPERNFNYTVTAAQLPQLTTASSVVVRLNQPGSMYLPRVNDLDLTGSFVINVRNWRIRPQADLFNVFNRNNVLTETNQYPLIGVPTTILGGRLLRVGVQADF